MQKLREIDSFIQLVKNGDFIILRAIASSVNVGLLAILRLKNMMYLHDLQVINIIYHVYFFYFLCKGCILYNGKFWCIYEFSFE
jgi:hypothetical protein